MPTDTFTDRSGDRNLRGTDAGLLRDQSHRYGYPFSHAQRMGCRCNLNLAYQAILFLVESTHRHVPPLQLYNVFQDGNAVSVADVQHAPG